MQEVIPSTLLSLTTLLVYPPSVNARNGIELGIAHSRDGLQFVAFGPARDLSGFEGTASEYEGQCLLIGPANSANLAALRALFPWLLPGTLDLRTSAGFGDRLGLATPGHVRAMRAVGGRVAPIFAQQSIREMKRTNRSPQQVMDDATWGVFAEGWRHGFGADADHLKNTADIDSCLAAGFTFYTIDPGEFVDNSAPELTLDALETAFQALPWPQLEDKPQDTFERYLQGSLALEGYTVAFDALALKCAAVKYGRVVAHVLRMYRHLASAAGSRSWEMEISVDETELPTSHLEHIYIANELQRLNVHWVSLAPRYIGRFEKGVDFIGDLDALEADLAVHAAIARHFGPYKLSLHSGSDKFSVYPIAARQAQGLVHLKTAGTSYLEALRTIGAIDPAYFREIYAFAFDRYVTDRATYHVSAQLDRAPAPATLPDDQLLTLMDQFDAREILHVTFGSVLTERSSDGTFRFHDHVMELLRAHPDVYAANLEQHFRRHIEPFAAQVSS